MALQYTYYPNLLSAPHSIFPLNIHSKRHTSNFKGYPGAHTNRLRTAQISQIGRKVKDRHSQETTTDTDKKRATQSSLHPHHSLGQLPVQQTHLYHPRLMMKKEPYAYPPITYKQIAW